MSIIINNSGDILSGSINGEVFAVTYSDELLKKMTDIADKANSVSTVAEYKELVEDFKKLATEDISGHVESFSPYIYVDRKTGNYHLKHNNVISAVPMPEAMVERIKDSVDKKIDFMPLIKAWVRFLRNPNTRRKGKAFSDKFFNFVNIKYTNQEMVSKLMEEKGLSREVAEKAATTYSMKITNEGLLAGFKVSREITKRYKLNEKGEKESYNVYESAGKTIDPISGLITYTKVELSNEERVFEPAVMGTGGDEFFCGTNKGHLIRVGQTHKLESWDQINTSDNQSCVAGLHVGGLDYIRGYQHSDTCTHNVFIDPAHVGAIPDDHTGAIRCIQYFVADEFSGVNGSIYHSSKYAAQTDAEWDAERAKVIKEHGELKAKKEAEDKAAIDELGSLDIK
jgi:hypothetical protein